MLTAGLIELGPAIGRSISSEQAGHGVREAGKTDELIDHALELDTRTEAYQLAGKLADGTARMSEYNIGELAKAYNAAGGDMAFMRTPDANPDVETEDGEIKVPELPELDAETEAANYKQMTPEQVAQRMQENIQGNTAAKEKGVETALVGGMTALIGVEERIQKQSSNVNHPGIGLAAILQDYFSYFEGDSSLNTAAQSMASEIRQVMSTHSLTEAEIGKLKGVLTDIVGDAELAEAYVRAVDGETLGGYNNKETKDTGGAVKYFKDEQLTTKPNKAYFWSGNSNGVGGKGYAMNYAVKNGGTTLEGLMKSHGISMPTWDISDPDAMKAWENASAKYADQASGEVHALIGTSMRPNSVWRTIELPRLMDNPHVIKIIVIDPETMTKTIIFERRRQI